MRLLQSTAAFSTVVTATERGLTGGVGLWYREVANSQGVLH
jgi:hypothetical protein